MQRYPGEVPGAWRSSFGRSQFDRSIVDRQQFAGEPCLVAKCPSGRNRFVATPAPGYW
ncbi:hypothetical protein [Sphingobium sp. SCG-1]|uniref:hypothetical protein n=1 Tax=Sphingobium sp. SCG-1 TaxID=2072936 RepID=UPI0016703BA2|nr:hypothetical protein [Sphingobium sp. SCG-1]